VFGDGTERKLIFFLE